MSVRYIKPESDILAIPEIRFHLVFRPIQVSRALHQFPAKPFIRNLEHSQSRMTYTFMYFTERRTQLSNIYAHECCAFTLTLHVSVWNNSIDFNDGRNDMLPTERSKLASADVRGA